MKRLSILISITFTFLILITSFQNFSPASATGAIDCSPQKIQEVLEPATAAKSAVTVRCNIRLRSQNIITKRLIISGEAASGITVDCNGATLESAGVNEGKDMIVVNSSKMPDGTWSRPENVKINSCRVNGSIRVYGMSTNGEGAELRNSSRSEGHTQRAQRASPKNIAFDHMKVFGTGRIPVYFSPGVTHSSFSNSEIAGQSSSVAIYLDAESASNTFSKNSIHTETNGRELIAIDGSASNLFVGNRFSSLNHGGIYLYRNCGEGGTVRHQTPSHNQIINNIFYYNHYQGANPGVWVASRNGNRKYCGADAGFPFGSSSDDRDNVKGTVIAQNQFYKLDPSIVVRLNDSPNFIYANQTVRTAFAQASGCYRKGAFPSEFLMNGQSSEWALSNGSFACNGSQYTCNEGVLTRTPSACTSPRPEAFKFECQVSGSNWGCSGDVRCPAGKSVYVVKAACNLESGKVAASQIEALPWNNLQVVRASDHVDEGVCSLNGLQIREGISFVNLQGSSVVHYSCQEHDKNGGDCHVRGGMICL